MDDQILALYAKGMTTRDIASTFKELYGADVSHSLISNIAVNSFIHRSFLTSSPTILSTPAVLFSLLIYPPLTLALHQ